MNFNKQNEFLIFEIRYLILENTSDFQIFFIHFLISEIRFLIFEINFLIFENSTNFYY